MAGVERTIRNLGDPAWCPSGRVCRLVNGRRETITVIRPCRESEGAIVVMTPGNAGRAKGPYHKRVSMRYKEIRLGIRPATE